MNGSVKSLVLLTLGGAIIYVAYKGNYKAVATAVATGSFPQGAASDGTQNAGGTIGPGDTAPTGGTGLTPGGTGSTTGTIPSGESPIGKRDENGYLYYNVRGDGTCTPGMTLTTVNGYQVCKHVPATGGDVTIQPTGIFR